MQKNSSFKMHGCSSFLAILYFLCFASATASFDEMTAAFSRNYVDSSGRVYRINLSGPLNPVPGCFISRSGLLAAEKRLAAMLQGDGRANNKYSREYYSCLEELFPCTDNNSIIGGSCFLSFLDRNSALCTGAPTLRAILLITDGLGPRNAISFSDFNEETYIAFNEGLRGFGASIYRSKTPGASNDCYENRGAITKILAFFSDCGRDPEYKKMVEEKMEIYRNSKNNIAYLVETPYFLLQTYFYEYLLRNGLDTYLEFVQDIFSDLTTASSYEKRKYNWNMPVQKRLELEGKEAGKREVLFRRYFVTLDEFEKTRDEEFDNYREMLNNARCGPTSRYSVESLLRLREINLS